MLTINQLRESTVVMYSPKHYYVYIDNPKGAIVYTYYPYQSHIKIEQLGNIPKTRDFPVCRNKEQYIRALRDFHFLNS